MNKLLFVLLCLSLSSFSTFAQTSEKCNFEIKCDGFKLSVKSKNSDCTNDDGEIYFSKNKSSSPKKLDIKPAWFYEVDHIGDAKARCSSSTFEKYPAYKTKGKIIVFLRLNNRPSMDIISAFLLDPKTGKVLDTKILGTYMRRTLGILKSQKGFKVQIIKDQLKQMKCDCDAAFVEGTVEIFVEENKLKHRWI